MAGGAAPIGPAASPLGQAWGYGIVLGIGFLFALGMVCLHSMVVLLDDVLTIRRSSLLGFSSATTMNCKRRKCSQRLVVRSSLVLWLVLSFRLGPGLLHSCRVPLLLSDMVCDAVGVIQFLANHIQVSLDPSGMPLVPLSRFCYSPR